MANRLAREKSPYLLQHAENPVDWYAWGPEALDRAVREDKPILVSIGYSACHWCHVMEHESFEDEATARLMNENFVNIKVDREERPDVDAIYMEAVQALTGSGGWPLNVFLTPDGRPFYGGTYFPPQPRHGLPSWQEVLASIASAYRDEHGGVLKNAAALTQYVQQAQKLPPSQEPLTVDLLTDVYAQMEKQADWTNGGFGAAPKFPQPLALEFFLRMHRRSSAVRARELVELTLHRMAEGGLFDQLGGGFHRYTVDAAWVVPHFEKMLYDNALLARTYAHAYQLSGDPWYCSIAEKTLDYLLRDMQSPEGGFYSAQDADSEGAEGKYYVWTPSEIDRLLGPDDAALVALRFGITPYGNFEGQSILTVASSIDEISQQVGRSAEDVASALRQAEARLLEVRSQRVPPTKDTKILTSWNALAIRAMAEVGRILGRDDYLEAAVDGAAFIANQMCPNGQLVRSYKDGPGNIRAFLEDYAYLVEALITLYETTFDSGYLRTARELADEMVKRFWDDGQGGFYDVQADAADLVVRPRSFFDNPTPSGNSSASLALLRLEALTGESAYGSWAAASFRAVRDVLTRMPLGFAYWLCGLDFYLAGATQIAVVGDVQSQDTRNLVSVVEQRYLPNTVIAVGEGSAVPLLAGRDRIGGAATAYVCRQFSCRLPVTDSADLIKQLEVAPS